nr:MAPEG family protein [Amylibacter sp.]
MHDFAFPITAWSTVLLGVLYLWLTILIIMVRRSDGIVLGDNNDRIMAKKIRGQANAAEQIPLGLILIALNESLNPTPITLVIAAFLVVGRYLHAVYFAKDGTHFRFRLYGMLFTLIAQILGLIGVVAGLLF